MMTNGEYFIIKGLLTFHDYAIKYQDKLEIDFFYDQNVKVLLKAIKKYYFKYSRIPSIEQLITTCIKDILVENPERISAAEDTLQSITVLESNRDDFYKWLEDETKIFIKTKRIENALMAAMPLMNKGDHENIEEAVKLINDANSVSFDDTLGLDYFEDMNERLQRLSEGVNVIPSGYQQLDALIGGGWRNKSLTVFGAATGVGKTMIMSDISYKLLKQGKNGLYITLEINQDWLANRIDANLSNIELNDLKDHIPTLKNSIEEKKSSCGRLIIKEYSPGCLNSNMILAYVRELQLKKSFKPDFICLDYLGLMTTNGKAFSDNTYGKLKTVSEELRSIACILDIPVFTGVQTNRDGYGSSDVGMEKTADSIGIPMTADIMIMVSRDEDMKSENKMYWKIAKCRYYENGGGLFMNTEYGCMRLTPAVANDTAYKMKEQSKNNKGKTKSTVIKTTHATNEGTSINVKKDTPNDQEPKKAINV